MTPTSSLSQRFWDLEEEFLTATDTSSLNIFVGKWTQLQDELEHTSAGEYDLDVARSVATRIAIVAESLGELEDKYGDGSSLPESMLRR